MAATQGVLVSWCRMTSMREEESLSRQGDRRCSVERLDGYYTFGAKRKNMYGMREIHLGNPWYSPANFDKDKSRSSAWEGHGYREHIPQRRGSGSPTGSTTLDQQRSAICAWLGSRMDNREGEKIISTVAPRRLPCQGLVYPLNLPIVVPLGKKAPEILEELLPNFYKAVDLAQKGWIIMDAIMHCPWSPSELMTLFTLLGVRPADRPQLSAMPWKCLSAEGRVTWSLPLQLPTKGSSIQQLGESGKEYPSPLS